ncbi:MAG: T9SS type A sorting domain-containing protein, partial [Bacteroidia bacterium]|nr:T9SS type A sorting domain-containing protein [Bacteroidia bacterium]
PTLTINTAGSHTFVVNVSSPNGGSDNNLLNNNSNQIFYISNNLTVTAGNVQTCQGSPVTITANGATSYSWNTGAITSTISVNPSATTIYTVTGTTGVCVQSKTVSATVQLPPTLSISRSSVCYGALTTLTAQGASTYVWKSSTGNLNGATMAVTLIAPTTYSLVGATTAGCSSTLVTTIQIDPLPVNTVVATHVTCGGCSDATVSVASSGATQPYTYLWTPGSITTAQIDNVSEGCYTVVVTDAKGCKSTDTTCVLFDVGISEINSSLKEIVLMPNPTKASFEIKFGMNTSRTIEVVDALGRIVKTTSASGPSITLDLAKFADGVYYVKIISGDRIETRKIVKQQ